MFGVSTWEEVRNLQFTFKKIVDVPGVEIERVFPTQQQAVKQINEALCNDSRVNKIILFGSSVNMRCTIHSDLDVLIFMNDLSNEAKLDVSEKLQNACNWNADILWADRIDDTERIMQEARLGVRIV